MDLMEDRFDTQPLFSCCSNFNEKALKDFFFYNHVFSMKNRICIIVLTLLTVMMIGLCVWTGEISSEIIMFFAVLAAIIVMMLVLYRVEVKTTIKRIREISGGEDDPDNYISRADFFEDVFEQRTPRQNLRVSYDSIKRVVVHKSYIYLTSKTRVSYILDRGGFTAGSARGLLDFLAAKGMPVQFVKPVYDN